MHFAGKFFAVAALATGLHLGAQELAAPASRGQDSVTLHVVVTQGDKGKPVPELAQNTFSVLDNGAPQSLTSFHAVSGPAAPVQVLLAIDAVNVPFQRIAYERGELDKFLRANGGKLAQPTAIAIVTDTGVEAQPSYTTDGNATADVLDKQVIALRTLTRSSGFFGAEERLDISLKSLGQMLARNTQMPGRKFVLWLSPGWPLLSGPGVQLSGSDQDRIFKQVVGFNNALRSSNTTMYVVDPIGAGESPGRTFYFEDYLKGVRKPSQTALADLGAQVLAVQSGGLFLGGNNDLAALMTKCYADASAYYELTYDAPPNEGADQYHKVEVRVAEPRMTARALQGYYSGSDVAAAR